MSFKVELLQDPSIRWLFERRVNILIQEIEGSEDTEEEWENLKKRLKQAAKESIGMKRKWDEHLAKVINEKKKHIRKVYQRYLQKMKLNTKDEGR
jgi:hypothetical protein